MSFRIFYLCCICFWGTARFDPHADYQQWYGTYPTTLLSVLGLPLRTLIMWTLHITVTHFPILKLPLHVHDTCEE